MALSNTFTEMFDKGNGEKNFALVYKNGAPVEIGRGTGVFVMDTREIAEMYLLTVTSIIEQFTHQAVQDVVLPITIVEIV